MSDASLLFFLLVLRTTATNEKKKRKKDFKEFQKKRGPPALTATTSARVPLSRWSSGVRKRALGQCKRHQSGGGGAHLFSENFRATAGDVIEPFRSLILIDFSCAKKNPSRAQRKTEHNAFNRRSTFVRQRCATNQHDGGCRRGQRRENQSGASGPGQGASLCLLRVGGATVAGARRLPPPLRRCARFARNCNCVRHFVTHRANASPC